MKKTVSYTCVNIGMLFHVGLLVKPFPTILAWIRPEIFGEKWLLIEDLKRKVSYIAKPCVWMNKKVSWKSRAPFKTFSTLITLKQEVLCWCIQTSAFSWFLVIHNGKRQFFMVAKSFFFSQVEYSYAGKIWRPEEFVKSYVEGS